MSSPFSDLMSLPFFIGIIFDFIIMSSFIVLSYLIFIFTLGLFSVRESRVQIYLGPFFSARISRANLLYETCLKLLSEVFSVEMNVRLQVL